MAFPSRNTADIINEFREYRGQPKWTDQEIRDNYQVWNHIPPPLFRPPQPAFNHLLPPLPAQLAQPALSQEEQNFLASAIPDLEDAAQIGIAGGQGNWRGTKFLGSGSFGYAGLWEYQGPDPKNVKHRTVVVKESSEVVPGSLREEGTFLTQLKVTKSPHIAHILNDPQEVNSQAENINPAWNNEVRRLIMKYCSVGDLGDILQRFHRLGKPLRETTLWKIFECLVDGITVLGVGNEFKVSNEPEVTIRQNWDKIIHFDLKPANILLGEDRSTHFTTPVCKIGDFGLAWRFRANASWNRKMSLRQRGTQRFYAPEQFSEWWEGADYNTTGIAGVYDTKTNVWGIGCIMYCLVLMRYRGPDPKQPFTPRWKLNGDKPKGRTFGLPLRGQSPHYSRTLTDLVQECLYEIPGHRPDLNTLKARVRNGWAAAFDANPTLDAWEDFLPPPPPPPPKRKGRVCKGTWRTGRACNRRPTLGGYCKKHQDQRP